MTERERDRETVGKRGTRTNAQAKHNSCGFGEDGGGKLVGEEVVSVFSYNKEPVERFSRWLGE